MPKKDTTLKEMLTIKLSALYDVETQITKALPKMASKASDPELKNALEKHLEETKEQAARLQQIFSLLGLKPEKLASEGIRGIVTDAGWMLKNVNGQPPRDAAIIASCQYVEHYEIAGYGTAVEWAALLGENEIQDLLETSLEEEKNADQTLSDLAVSQINETVELGNQQEESV